MSFTYLFKKAKLYKFTVCRIRSQCLELKWYNCMMAYVWACIESVGKDSYGIYCKTTFLYLTVPPSSPVFASVATTSNSSTITWTHPPTSDVQAYTVSWLYMGPCSLLGETPEDGSQVLEGSRRSFTLTNLRANSQYLVRVEARNDIGTSNSSITVNTSYAGKFSSQLLKSFIMDDIPLIWFIENLSQVWC